MSEWLLTQGVSVNAVDAFGLTPLAEAVRWNHKELSRMLHSHGGRLLINGNLVTYTNFDAKVRGEYTSGGSTKASETTSRVDPCPLPPASTGASPERGAD